SGQDATDPSGGAGRLHQGAAAGRTGAHQPDSFVARVQAAVAGDGSGALQAAPGGQGGTGAGQGAGHPGGFTTSGAGAGSGDGMAAMPAEAVTELVSQLDQRIHAAQGSATRYLSDPARFASAEVQQAPASDRLLAALTTLQVTSPAA